MIIVSEALKSLKWLDVRDKLIFNDLFMVYKCLKKLTAGYLHRRFQNGQKLTGHYRQNNDLLSVASVQAGNWPKDFCLLWGKYAKYLI